jgi:hypothetical protein
VIWSTSWAIREINLYIIGPVTIRSEMCKLSIASLKFHSPASSRRSISTESGVSVDSLDSQGEGVQFWREENSKQTWTDLPKPVLLYVFFFWFPLVYTTCYVILEYSRHALENSHFWLIQTTYTKDNLLTLLHQIPHIYFSQRKKCLPSNTKILREIFFLISLRKKKLTLHTKILREIFFLFPWEIFFLFL